MIKTKASQGRGFKNHTLGFRILNLPMGTLEYSLILIPPYTSEHEGYWDLPNQGGIQLSWLTQSDHCVQMVQNMLQWTI